MHKALEDQLVPFHCSSMGSGESGYLRRLAKAEDRMEGHIEELKKDVNKERVRIDALERSVAQVSYRV